MVAECQKPFSRSFILRLETPTGKQKSRFLFPIWFLTLFATKLCGFTFELIKSRKREILHLIDSQDLTLDQQHGARFLAKSRVALLADVPGYGKTAQLVRAFDALGIRNANIIVPNRVLSINTGREFDKWAWNDYGIHPVVGENDPVPLDGVVISSYALAIRDAVHRRLMKRRVEVLACDEAHRLKSTDAQGSKKILRASGLAGKTDRVWLFSGTPAPNHAGELFIFAKLCGAWTGSESSFEARFCVFKEGQLGMKVIGSKNHAELKAMLAPYILRRTEVEGRPALSVDQMHVEGTGTDPFAALSPEELAIIEAAILVGDFNFADMQAVTTARRLVGIAKADGSADLCREALEGGHNKILVGCLHTGTIDKIAAGLEKYGCEIFDGRTQQRKRIGIIDRFQETNSGLRVIVGQMQAMGEGNTLTEASRIIIAEPDWTPKGNGQFVARAWRRGQKSPVHATLVSLANSIDDGITKALRRKTADIAQLF